MKLILAVPLLASLAVVLVVARLAGSLLPSLPGGLFSPNRTVPSLVNRSLAEATALAQAAGLTVSITRGDPNLGQVKDTVLAQAPPAGAQLRGGDTVRLTVSPGLKPPNVVGKTLDQARADLLLAGWSAAPEPEVRTVAGALPNVVLEQRPGPDDLAPSKGTVTLVIPSASLTVGRPTLTSYGQPATES